LRSLRRVALLRRLALARWARSLKRTRKSKARLESESESEREKEKERQRERERKRERREDSLKESKGEKWKKMEGIKLANSNSNKLPASGWCFSSPLDCTPD